MPKPYMIIIKVNENKAIINRNNDNNIKDHKKMIFLNEKCESKFY